MIVNFIKKKLFKKMSDDSPDAETSVRYYATKPEQQLLVWGLRQYFSFPERSSNRNKIAAQITAQLQMISPHWTHRAVRLWFNNNKKNFLSDTQQMFPPMAMQMMQMIPPQQFVMPPMSPQVLQSSPQICPMPQISAPKPQQQLMKSPPAVTPPQVSQNPKPQPKVPTATVIPQIPVPAIPQPTPPLHIPQQNATRVTLPAIRPPPPKVSFDTQQPAAPVKQHVMPAITAPKPKHSQLIIQPQVPTPPSKQQTQYNELNQIIKQIKAKGNFDIKELRDEFDKKCQSIISTEGVCLSEKIEYGVPFVKFRNSQENSNDDLLIEVPSDFCIPQKSFSFLDGDSLFHQISQPDLTLVKPAFQDRRFDEQKVGTYDKASISSTVAAYTSNDLLSPKKIISFTDLSLAQNSWSQIPVPTKCPIEAFYVDSNNAWCYSDSMLYRARRIEQNKVIPLTLPGEKVRGVPYIKYDTRNANGAIIGFSQSSSLYFVGNEIIEQKTPYKGFTSLLSFNDNILCVSNDSYSIRMMSRTGEEISSYVGHCNYVRNIIAKDENVFITSSDDNTVRMWDRRSPLSSTQISCSTNCICQDGNYIILGLANRGLAVFDVRSSAIKVCVNTQDYIAESISYNAKNDELFMFGVIARDVCKDSMMFIDNDGNSRKRVFRRYHSFAAISSC